MIALALLLSYVLGSVPTGLWLGQRLRGVDIREHGSKNIGATNTLRVLGKGLGAVALVGDMLKGAIAVVVFARLSDWIYAPYACGLAAIAGHNWSVFLKFGGGKGVATSAGVFWALAPLAMSITVAIFVVVFAATRMVSAGSLAGALAMTVLVFALPHDTVLRVLVCLVAAFVVVKHRSNIQRILNGTENRF